MESAPTIDDYAATLALYLETRSEESLYRASL